MADRFDLDAIEADDALLDLLAAGGESAWEAGEHDPALKLLADLRLAVEVEDELPVETIDDPENFLARCAALNPVTDPFARKMAARGLALGVAAVAALSVSGVAAAVTGDPLSPYEKVIEKVVDGLRPQTSFPQEQLDGMPVVDKTKIVKVAKDYQKKVEEQKAAAEEKVAQNEDPLTFPPASVVAQTPPLLLARPQPTQVEEPTTVQEPVEEQPVQPQQPVDEPTTPTEDPTAPTATTPPPTETTDPPPTTTEPTTPVEPGSGSNGDPGTQPTAPPETGTGEAGTGGSGDTSTGDTTTGDTTAGGDQTGDTAPQSGGGGEQSESADLPVGNPPAAQSADQGNKTDERAADEKPTIEVPPVLSLAPVVPVVPVVPVEEPTRLEQYIGKSAASGAKHSNGKPWVGYVRAKYATGKHSSGLYAEGRHAAIARAHGSMKPVTLRQILGVLNTPMTGL
ncbi:hypothetical protein EV644_108159 [Kribbella orskensis]|uniref:Anti-sigma-D factor RsdA-like protein n=1 Tax=Kribbella orskensis TaxID=2512216 RepID=A0ABY2BIR5_9ACTN|nr:MULTISPECIES: hypothetical protein [Kribbella]TCN38764.1 hypothetical protein EV642_108159 [Kribbella sp. VKM Ac-2500]TCO20945.1 hypothetical protein EV644_108159 [Kribbella orskensis]